MKGLFSLLKYILSLVKGKFMADNESRKLGDLESSEKLIYDLYIDLRKRVNSWAAITGQTAQARMGYVGQHLVSVVTDYRGGKSGLDSRLRI